MHGTTKRKTITTKIVAMPAPTSIPNSTMASAVGSHDSCRKATHDVAGVCRALIHVDLGPARAVDALAASQLRFAPALSGSDCSVLILVHRSLAMQERIFAVAVSNVGPPVGVTEGGNRKKKGKRRPLYGYRFVPRTCARFVPKEVR
jgi:hypothetical protein